MKFSLSPYIDVLKVLIHFIDSDIEVLTSRGIAVGKVGQECGNEGRGYF